MSSTRVIVGGAGPDRNQFGYEALTKRVGYLPSSGVNAI
jgi:hypothetical protein